MTPTLPLLHHVVFAIDPERLDRAADYLTALGFQFVAFEHEELGLQIRLDWDHGFRADLADGGGPERPGHGGRFPGSPRRRSLLGGRPNRRLRCGRTYCVAFRVKSDFRQHVEGDGFEVTEVKLESMFGILLTLLKTNLP
ncbi:MAG: hypothetical protein ABW001_15370 [Mycobacterium sp.]